MEKHLGGFFMAAQVANRPTADAIRKMINTIFGPTEIISREDGEKVKLFIPANVVEALAKANMKQSLGLVDEEKVLSHPNLRAFRV